MLSPEGWVVGKKNVEKIGEKMKFKRPAFSVFRHYLLIYLIYFKEWFQNPEKSIKILTKIQNSKKPQQKIFFRK